MGSSEVSSTVSISVSLEIDGVAEAAAALRADSRA